MDYENKGNWDYTNVFTWNLLDHTTLDKVLVQFVITDAELMKLLNTQC